jgi:hypothetical protein
VHVEKFFVRKLGDLIRVRRGAPDRLIAERCGAFAPPTQYKPGEPFACDGSNLDPILKFDASGRLVKSRHLHSAAWPSC